jgi:hypothetical protein
MSISVSQAFPRGRDRWMEGPTHGRCRARHGADRRDAAAPRPGRPAGAAVTAAGWARRALRTGLLLALAVLAIVALLPGLLVLSALAGIAFIVAAALVWRAGAAAPMQHVETLFGLLVIAAILGGLPHLAFASRVVAECGLVALPGARRLWLSSAAAMVVCALLADRLARRLAVVSPVLRDGGAGPADAKRRLRGCSVAALLVLLMVAGTLFALDPDRCHRDRGAAVLGLPVFANLVIGFATIYVAAILAPRRRG